MIDWYYHDPGEGRIGPLSAEELCKRFHDRRIQHDTLVWRNGLRTGRCLRNEDPRVADVRNEVRRRFSADVRFATIEGGCAFEMALGRGEQPGDGPILRYEGYREGNGFAWECAGGTLPENERPYECRSRG